jgi:hypothetical protein
MANYKRGCDLMDADLFVLQPEAGAKHKCIMGVIHLAALQQSRPPACNKKAVPIMLTQLQF